jgi:hypothetical protein
MTSGPDASPGAPGGKAVETETVGDDGAGTGTEEKSSDVGPSSGSDGWFGRSERELGQNGQIAHRRRWISYPQ